MWQVQAVNAVQHSNVALQSVTRYRNTDSHSCLVTSLQHRGLFKLIQSRNLSFSESQWAQENKWCAQARQTLRSVGSQGRI